MVLSAIYCFRTFYHNPPHWDITWVPDLKLQLLHYMWRTSHLIKTKKKNGFCWQMLSGSIPSRVQRTRTKSTNTWKEFSFSQVSPEKENVLLRVSLPGNKQYLWCVPTNVTGVLNGRKNQHWCSVYIAPRVNVSDIVCVKRKKAVKSYKSILMLWLVQSTHSVNRIPRVRPFLRETVWWP